MKIQNITFINQFNRANKINTNQQFKTKNLPFDTVSFSSKKLDVREVLNLAREADKIKSRASEVQNDAQSYLPIAKAKFKDSYDAYLLAHKYLKIVMKNPSNPNIELPNGDMLKFKFVLENNSLNVHMDILDSTENKKYTILTKGPNPTQVIEYDDFEKGTIYQYLNNEIVVSDNMGLNGPNAGICDANYVFIDGQLASVRTNVSHRIPQTSDEFYYFVDDKLAIAEIDNSMNLMMGTNRNKERYTFVADSLFNYYENFSAFGRGRLTFDESFHYINGVFIAHTVDSRQIDNQGTIKAQDMIYMKNGQYYQAENKTFHIKDAGVIKIDNE